MWDIPPPYKGIHSYLAGVEQHGFTPQEREPDLSGRHNDAVLGVDLDVLRVVAEEARVGVEPEVRVVDL